MPAQAPATTNVIAVLIAMVAALFARSWLQVALLQDGYEQLYAADLSWLVVPPVLVVLLLPVLTKDRQFLKQQFRRTDLDLHVVLTAVAIGVLLRMSWWSQLVAGISFGIYQSEDPFAVAGPVFSFACPPPPVLFLGLFVMAVMVPLVEELTHRAYVQTALNRFGPIVAVAGSAVVFTVLHKPGGWEFVFVGGIVFGTQYLLTGSLWSSLITHATVNGLAQLDWRCLNGQWNPHSSVLPLWDTGSIAVTVLLTTVVGIACLLYSSRHRGG